MNLYEAWEEMNSKNILLEYKVGKEFNELSDSDKTLLQKTMNKFYDSSKYSDEKKEAARKLVKQNLLALKAKVKDLNAKSKLEEFLKKVGEVKAEEPKESSVTTVPEELKKDIEVKTDITPEEVKEELESNEINFVQLLINRGLKEYTFFSFAGKTEKNRYKTEDGDEFDAFDIQLQALKIPPKEVNDIIRKLYRKEYLDSSVCNLKNWDGSIFQKMFFYISPKLIKLLRNQGIDTTEKKGFLYITNYLYWHNDIWDNIPIETNLYKEDKQKGEEIINILRSYSDFSNTTVYTDYLSKNLKREWIFKHSNNTFEKEGVHASGMCFVTKAIPTNTLNKLLGQLKDAGAKVYKEFVPKNSKTDPYISYEKIEGTPVYDYVMKRKNPKFIEQINKEIDKQLKSHTLSDKELSNGYAIRHYNYDNHYMDYGETNYIVMTGKELVRKLGQIQAYNFIKGKIGTDNQGRKSITTYDREENRYSLASKYEVPKEVQARWKKWGYKVVFAK